MRISRKTTPLILPSLKLFEHWSQLFSVIFLLTQREASLSERVVTLIYAIRTPHGGIHHRTPPAPLPVHPLAKETTNSGSKQTPYEIWQRREVSIFFRLLIILLQDEGRWGFKKHVQSGFYLIFLNMQSPNSDLYSLCSSKYLSTKVFCGYVYDPKNEIYRHGVGNRELSCANTSKILLFSYFRFSHLMFLKI